jgi:YcxB-like protein
VSEQTSIEITATLTVKDLYLASFRVLARRSWLLLIVLTVAVGVLALAAEYHLMRPSALSFYSSIFLGIAVVYVVVLFGAPYFTARKNLATSKNLKGEVRYIFTDSGFAMTTPIGRGYLDWPAIYRAVESGDYFLLYLSHFIYYLIPKRCFRDQEQIEEFKNLVRNRVEGKVRFRKSSV